MAFIAYSDIGYVLVDLPVEDIESAVLLDLMSPIDIHLDFFFLFNYFLLHSLFLTSWQHGYVGSGEEFCSDGCGVAWSLAVNKFDIGVLANWAHVALIVALELVFHVE